MQRISQQTGIAAADNGQEKRLHLPEPFPITSSSFNGDLHSRYRFTDARAADERGEGPRSNQPVAE